MAEENKGIIGGLASGVASGVYEGVKGAAIGGIVGAVTGGAIDAFSGDTIQEISRGASTSAVNLGVVPNPVDGAAVTDAAKEFFNTVSGLVPQAGSVANFLMPGVGDLTAQAIGDTAQAMGAATTPVAGEVAKGLNAASDQLPMALGAIGAVAGGTLGAVNGLIGNNSPTDRAQNETNNEQDQKIDQLAAATQMLGAAVMGTQQELMATQQQLQTTNNALKVVGKYTGDALKHKSGTQAGSFVAKEEARRAAQGSKETAV